MFNKIWTWLKGLFAKGKSDMSTIANEASAAVATGKADLETIISDAQATVGAVKAAVTTEVDAAVAVVADLEVAASKIKDICDRLGIAVPVQWNEIVALAKVL